jgi:hypothetical protein
MIDPKLLCRNHLLGEHLELHKFKSTFDKHYSISGRISPIVQIEPENMKVRHDELVKEMLFRGYNHKSEYEQPDLSYLLDSERYAKVDLDYNLKDLCNRCEACRIRIEENYENRKLVFNLYG